MILNKKVERQYIYFLDNGHLLECKWLGNPLICSIIYTKNGGLEDKKIWQAEVSSTRDIGTEWPLLRV
jgi:hypothetical protein